MRIATLTLGQTRHRARLTFRIPRSIPTQAAARDGSSPSPPRSPSPRRPRRRGRATCDDTDEDNDRSRETRGLPISVTQTTDDDRDGRPDASSIMDHIGQVWGAVNDEQHRSAASPSPRTSRRCTHCAVWNVPGTLFGPDSSRTPGRSTSCARRLLNMLPAHRPPARVGAGQPRCTSSCPSRTAARRYVPNSTLHATNADILEDTTDPRSQCALSGSCTPCTARVQRTSSRKTYCSTRTGTASSRTSGSPSVLTDEPSDGVHPLRHPRSLYWRPRFFWFTARLDESGIAVLAYSGLKGPHQVKRWTGYSAQMTPRYSLRIVDDMLQIGARGRCERAIPE